MPKKRKLFYVYNNQTTAPFHSNKKHFIYDPDMQLSDIVFPPACNNGFSSYTVQCKQDLICANMCSQKRYVTVVTLRFKCIQHLVNKWFRFSKNKCFLPIASFPKLMLSFQKSSLMTLANKLLYSRFVKLQESESWLFSRTLTQAKHLFK